MEQKSRRIGVVSIIIRKRTESAMKVNEILTAYGDVIIGRMGIPFEPKGIHVIALIINGTTDDIGALTGKLGNLPDVDVKSVLTKA
jgi:putative iron-only hydrogenase system regulator